MLVRALGYNALAGRMSDASLPFSDVTSNRGYIALAYDMGLITGQPDGTFQPGGSSTREQAAAILMRCYERLHTQSTEVDGDGYTLLTVETPAPSAETTVPTTPLEPLDALYEALRDARSSGADLSQVAVVFSAGGVVTVTSGSAIESSQTISASQVERYLQRDDVHTYYSTVYACSYLTYTNAGTHRIILDNLSRSPMYSGRIRATGTRYCPSIEDKLVRFADKPRHQIFIEPEGRTTDEMYVQGMSTSLPADVQVAMLRTLPGLERCEVARLGYAIEYDCIDPTALDRTLMVKAVPGLFTAGQLNGSSGYEEAAAQGYLAGVNAALYVRGEEPFLLGRDEAYTGVLVDDLATKGTPEPYRMMTSRCEYRLLLRQDNADLRLTERARRTGLISPERYDRLQRKREAVAAAMRALDASVPPSAALTECLAAIGSGPPAAGGARLFDLLKRPGMTYTALLSLTAGTPQALPALPDEAREQVEVLAHYDGYIQKQREEVARARRLEELALPDGLDYAAMHGLRLEARQKLAAVRPHSVGQAARISGVSPADISVLLIELKRREARA